MPESQRRIKVTTGDTLSRIARKRYGDVTKWREIESANPGLNLKKLKAGQILYLPNFPANGSHGEEAVITSPPHRFGAPCFRAGPV